MGATGGGQRVTAGSGMDAAAAANERAQLAKLCSSRDWSKAIRVLDSLLARSCTIQDICNRAFCYSQLELHKHVVKDCDKALHLDSKLVQAYILKGHALSALGRKDEAVLVWQHGYACALQEPMDLKQLLEFEELLGGAKQIKANIYDDHLMDAQSAITTVSDTYSDIDIKSNGAYEIESPPSWMSEKCNQSNGSNSMINAGTKNILKANTKTKSISLDFRLSRGIAQVNEGKYEEAISFFNQILKENRTSPEALIGRGTAHAFKRELEAAIADFSMAIDSNPVAGEAWKRRGQARAALGEYVEVSRSIGDMYLKKPELSRDPIFQQCVSPVALKRPVMTAEPSIRIHRLRQHDLFLIFASDGLWEQLTDEAAVEIVVKNPRVGIAKTLVKAAINEAARKREMRYSDIKKIEKGVRRHFHDDITVIVIFLDQRLGRSSKLRTSAIDLTNAPVDIFSHKYGELKDTVHSVF